jgi:prepilin-type N-terminal cleavage/methylation domain-containing protein
MMKKINRQDASHRKSFVWKVFKIGLPSGFTFIELMIVVVIIGVFAAMAIPRFGKIMDGFNLKTSGRDIISSLRLARSYAITQKYQFGIYFDPETNQYILFKDISTPGSYIYDGNDSAMQTQTLPHNVDFTYTSFSDNVVIFKPNGSASATGSVELRSEGVNDHITVDVLASTGRVKMVKVSY